MYEAACLDEKRMEILERNQRNLEERAKEDEQIKSGEIPVLLSYFVVNFNNV